MGKSKNIKNVLKKIVDSNSYTIFADSKKLYAYVSDLAPIQNKETKFIKTALKHDAGSKFYKTLNKKGKPNKDKLIQFALSLIDIGLSKELVSFTCECFLYSIGVEDSVLKNSYNKAIGITIQNCKNSTKTTNNSSTTLNNKVQNKENRNIKQKKKKSSTNSNKTNWATKNRRKRRFRKLIWITVVIFLYIGIWFAGCSIAAICENMGKYNGGYWVNAWRSFYCPGCLGMLLLSPIPYFIIKKINDYYNKKFPDPNLTISPDSQAYNLKASLIIAIIATIIGTILSATSCIITNTTDYYINLQGMDGIVWLIAIGSFVNFIRLIKK